MSGRGHFNLPRAVCRNSSLIIPTPYTYTANLVGNSSIVMFASVTCGSTYLWFQIHLVRLLRVVNLNYPG